MLVRSTYISRTSAADRDRPTAVRQTVGVGFSVQRKSLEDRHTAITNGRWTRPVWGSRPITSHVKGYFATYHTSPIYPVRPGGLCVSSRATHAERSGSDDSPSSASRSWSTDGFIANRRRFFLRAAGDDGAPSIGVPSAPSMSSARRGAGVAPSRRSVAGGGVSDNACLLYTSPSPRD